jgi:predicted component of type VI protein secretion system
MELVLRVIEGPNGDKPDIVARFDAEGGLIGRAESAHLSLPDAARVISRFHAHVSCEGDTYFLEEMGSANAAEVNGKALVPGQRSQLRPGDRIRIGHYIIAVEFDDPDFPATQVLDRDSRAFAAAAASQVPPDLLWRAFLQGAQLKMEAPLAAQREMLQSAGATLRAAVAGVRRLLAARARGEGDGRKTPLKSSSNNALRVATDDARAFSALLKSPGPGFMSGPEAVTEAIEEAVAHVTACAAATKAAADQVLAPLEAGAIEKRRPPSPIRDELLPLWRKAQLWNQFVRTQRALRADGAGLQDAFKRAFAKAYEAEIARLKGRSR